MFVPVACLKCGKMFQVPAAAAGTEVACPWCKAATPALPVAGVSAPDAGDSPEAQPEPLSLDDAPQVAEPPPAPVARPPFHFPLKTALGVLALMLVVAAVTVAVLGYGSGRFAASAWAEFTPPDGSCSVALPGTPTAGRVEPGADGITRGGERYTATGWYSGTAAWVGWQDLDPGWAKQAAADRDGVLTAPVIAAERDRRKGQVGGTITAEGTVRFGKYAGKVIQMDTPRGKLVERYILALDGPRPRLYFLGVEGKNLTPDSPAARRVFDSFRVRGE